MEHTVFTMDSLRTECHCKLSVVVFFAAARDEPDWDANAKIFRNKQTDRRYVIIPSSERCVREHVCAQEIMKMRNKNRKIVKQIQMEMHTKEIQPSILLTFFP